MCSKKHFQKLTLPLLFFNGYFCFFWLFFESYNLQLIIRKYAKNVSYTHITLLRAATYLLMLVNYNLGIGGILLGLSFKYGLKLKESTAIVLLYTFIDIFSLSFLTLVSTISIKNSISTPVFAGLFSTALVLLIALLAIYLFFTNINRIKHIIPLWLYKLIASQNRELSVITLRDLFTFTLFRMLYFLSFTVFSYFAIHFFIFTFPL